MWLTYLCGMGKRDGGSRKRAAVWTLLLCFFSVFVPGKLQYRSFIDIFEYLKIFLEGGNCIYDSVSTRRSV